MIFLSFDVGAEASLAIAVVSKNGFILAADSRIVLPGILNMQCDNEKKDITIT
jgi:hypothetical protein